LPDCSLPFPRFPVVSETARKCRDSEIFTGN